MGAVFGHAAKAAAREDIDAFEDAQLALQAMGSLGPRHFRVLDLVNESVLIQTEGGSDNLGQFVPAYVAERAAIRQSVAHQVLVNLAAAGLVDTVSAYGTMAYPITDLGRAVVQAGRAIASHDCRGAPDGPE